MKTFTRKGKFFVYILECRDGTYYTGYTADLARRVELHNTGKGAKYTRCRGPLKLVWSRTYAYYKRAILEERRIKRLSRKEKERLVLGGGMKERRTNLERDLSRPQSKTFSIMFSAVPQI